MRASDLISIFKDPALHDTLSMSDKEFWAVEELIAENAELHEVMATALSHRDNRILREYYANRKPPSNE